MPDVVTVEINCYREECFLCGVPIFIPNNLERRFRENGEPFYCVNGHSLTFGQGTNTALRKEIAALTAQRNLAESNLDVARKKIMTMEKRIKAGVCPYCHRTFRNVAHHMKTQHRTKRKAAP